MQVNVNQDAAVRQYTQAMQNTGTAATSSKAVADTTEEASKKKEQDTFNYNPGNGFGKSY